MSAKEEIGRLEQKVDILYNVVVALALEIGQDEFAEKLLADTMHGVNAVSLSESELRQIGQSK